MAWPPTSRRKTAPESDTVTGSCELAPYADADPERCGYPLPETWLCCEQMGQSYYKTLN